MPRLLIAASGTGGHLFPALAVADRMPDDWSVRWLGVPDRLERQLVPSRYPLFTVRAGGLQGRGLRKLKQLIQLLWSAWPVTRLIRKQECSVVFTTGGYIAAPAILAARLCRRPVVLHESNAIPGQVTRLFGRFCTRVALGLPQAADYLSGCRPEVTGTPVREDFLKPAACPDWVPAGDGPLLLVIGGSQGAVGLNRMVRAAAPALLAMGCRIVHLSGHVDPDQASCSTRPIKSAPSAMRSRRCCSTRIWRSHGPVPAASASWLSAEPQRCWCLSRRLPMTIRAPMPLLRLPLEPL